MQWTWDHHVRLWPCFPPQLNLGCTYFATEAAVFLLFSKRAGQVLGAAWTLDFSTSHACHVGWPDLCQLVMPATDRRPLNKGAPTMAEHCSSHRVLQPQALPCDPAWQECMTQHMLSCPELEMFIGRAARLTETKEIYCSRLELAPWLESLVSCGSMGLTPGLPV